MVFAGGGIRNNIAFPNLLNPLGDNDSAQWCRGAAGINARFPRVNYINLFTRDLLSQPRNNVVFLRS